jgi:hypothetical protein
MEYKKILQKASATYRRLGITAQIERAVIDHLKDLGAVDTCYTPNSADCTGGCPEGQGCVTSTTGNCVCTGNSKLFSRARESKRKQK